MVNKNTECDDIDMCEHSQFVTIIPMTSEEYQNEGEKLEIMYSFSETPFGEVLIASTPKGICELSFVEDKAQAIIDMKYRFPKAVYKEEVTTQHKDAVAFFDIDQDDPPQVTLHLRGTEFQLQVWEMLLGIPYSTVTSYGSMAEAIGNKKAARAIGGAVGKNPVAFIVPCHRVITSFNEIGGYRWGILRKLDILKWEGAIFNRGAVN